MADAASKVVSMKKVALASFVGALLEWYDFFLFGTAAAIVFGPLFFPNSTKLGGLLGAFTIFGVGFLARPLGGILFGHIGDRIGRKAGLIMTLTTIGASTFLIGLLPTYDTIGVAAPLLLLILRLVQAFGLGGEYAGAALITIEHAPDGRRGFWGSIPQAAAPAGVLLANAAFSLANLLPHDAFISWGWRLPFLISLVFTFVGLFIRLNLLETPAFEELKHEGIPKAPPLIQVFRDHFGNIVLATGARLAESISANVVYVLGISYVVTQLSLDRSIGLNGVMAASLIAIPVTVIFGAVSDRFGRRGLYLAGAGFMAAFSYPFFLMLGTKSFAIISLAFILAYNFGPVLMFAVEATFFSELFGSATRFTGLSIAYQVSAIVGGFMPLIGTLLLKLNHGAPWFLAGFLVAVCALSFLCAAAAKRVSSSVDGRLSSKRASSSRITAMKAATQR